MTFPLIVFVCHENCRGVHCTPALRFIKQKALPFRL